MNIYFWAKGQLQPITIKAKCLKIALTTPAFKKKYFYTVSKPQCESKNSYMFCHLNLHMKNNDGCFLSI